MAASPRIERVAARRGGISLNFAGKTMAQQRAGEQNPTPPRSRNGMQIRKERNFSNHIDGVSSPVEGVGFFLLQGHSLCCEMQVDICIPIFIYCATRTGQGNHIQDTVRYPVRRPLGKTFFFYNSCCRWRSVFLFI